MGGSICLTSVKLCHVSPHSPSVSLAPSFPTSFLHIKQQEVALQFITHRTFACNNVHVGRMASDQERAELDAKAKQGETVVPGGTGGKSLEAQEHFTEARSRGGQTRREQLGTEGYKELGHRGGETRREQMGHEGYQEMGRKGGLSTMDKSGGERAEEEGISIDESKFRTRS